MTQVTKCLTIAGSDSGGGAGIQADLKTFSALGCYGMSVITALTAQNTIGVQNIYSIEPTFIEEQLDSVLEDLGADAVKIGMLHSPEVIEKAANALQQHNAQKIVLDPVMVAKSGHKLLQDDAIKALKNQLLPLATIVTPNLPEAGVLLERKVSQEEDMAQAAEDIAQLGPSAVLVKGGHLTNRESTDHLYIKSPFTSKTISEEHVDTPNTHGTGCTLSSAIASFLARENDLEEAATSGKLFLTNALKAGKDIRYGKGQGPVWHFF
jgi:hydroxymethylpyrimidine/phosphomethylpyrimidine kinase